MPTLRKATDCSEIVFAYLCGHRRCVCTLHDDEMKKRLLLSDVKFKLLYRFTRLRTPPDFLQPRTDAEQSPILRPAASDWWNALQFSRPKRGSNERKVSNNYPHGRLQPPLGPGRSSVRARPGVENQQLVELPPAAAGSEPPIRRRRVMRQSQYKLLSSRPYAVGATRNHNTSSP